MITSRRCVLGLTLIAVLFTGGFADAAKKKKKPAYTPEEGSAELDKKTKRQKKKNGNISAVGRRLICRLMTSPRKQRPGSPTSFVF